MTTVDDMLREGASRQDVLATMRKRTKVEQDRVWSEGLARIQDRIQRAVNKAADALVERVKGGAIAGLFFDPLDEAESYCKAELRRSRSREEGERKRQRWLMDILVVIGAARVSGAETLADYPPAADLMQAVPEEEAQAA